MKSQIRRIIRITHEFLLRSELHPVFAGHEHGVRLTPGIDVVIVLPVFQLDIPRIVEVHLTVLDQRAS